MKRKLTLILTCAVFFVALCVLFCVSASAETYSGNCGADGDNVTWTLDTDTGVLEITGTGQMADYSSASAPWYNYRNSIQTVTVNDGVTNIGAGTFFACKSLTSVTIPDSVTSIGDRAFRSCTALQSFTIPDGVTEIGVEAFYNCTGLTEVTVGDGVISIGDSAFFYCIGLERVSLGKAVVTIGMSSFEGCSSLKEITIPDSVTTVGNCAFYGCPSLKSATIGNGVTSIGYGAFEDCTGLTSVTFGNSVETINHSVFRNCPSLRAITIPDSVTYIGSDAFLSCTNLLDVSIPDSVSIIGFHAFYDTAYFNDASNWEDDVLYIGKHLISANTTISGTYEIKPGTLTISENAFRDCKNLSRLTIPDSVTCICMNAFYNCSGLSQVHITDLSAWLRIRFSNPYSNPLSKAHNLYLNGTLVTDLVIPDDITSIGKYAFWYCTSLTSVTIPDNVTSIGTDVFANCTGLTCVTISQVGVDCFMSAGLYSGLSYSVILSDGVTSIGDEAFRYCRSLTSITIPNSVTSIGSGAFRGCESLQSIRVPNGVTSIGDETFYYCTNLASVTLPDGVTSIGNYAFYNCGSLQGITIPDSVTSIDDYAFCGCKKIPFITIWGGVTSIGSGAFYNCTSLKNVYNFSDLDITAGSTGNGYVAYYADSVGGAQEYCEAFGHTFAEGSDGEACELCGTRAFLSGVCGEEGGNIQWTLNTATGVLELTGTGNMADYTQSVSTPWGTDAFRVRTVLIGEGINRIGKYAFADCRNLTDVTIPASVTSIGESAFDGCTALNKVNISDIAAWCRMNFAGLTANPVYYAHRLYLNGELLTEVTIPEGVTSISLGAFYGCADLTKAVLPDSVSRICYYAFDGCTGLTEIVIPDGVTKIESFVFFGCTGLGTVTLPAELTTIGYAAFYRCNALTAVTLPESLKTIGTDAFYGCTKLKTVTNHSALPITAGSSDHGYVAKYADTVYSSKDGFTTVGGDLYYYQNGQVFKGWIVEDGVTYYAQPDTGIVYKGTQYINGFLFFWNDTTGLELANGFLETENGTICFENGLQVIGWRHADGTGPSVDENGIFEQYSSALNNLYYFLSTNGYMVTGSTYTIGGYAREFNADHTVKPISGLQNRYGEMYYYVDGVMQTGWQTVDGNTYYFQASDAVYGQAATKWMYIGNQLYYFYASTSATPYALKTSGTIGGITYQYAEDGHILYNGFVNCDYANAANSNTAANIQKKNGTARYYVGGVMQTGWQQIGGKWYYFYAVGSTNGSGYMCTESRTIGGVWYEFDANGVCTSKS